MSVHTVPRNIQKVETLFKGMTNRFIIITGLFVFLDAVAIINFFSTLEKMWYEKLIAIAIFFIIALIWILCFRTTKLLDRTFLFSWFFLSGVAGKNRIMKYIETDNKLNKLLPLNRFLIDGTITFNHGVGWLYAFESDIVTQDNFKTFNALAQSFLNSLTDNIFFKIEIRIEPKYDMQALTLSTNDLINSEKNPRWIEHLKSIQEYSKQKEENDYEKNKYFFVGIDSTADLEELKIMGEKIHDGLKIHLSNLNITFNKITDPYTLFEFYRGEF